RLLPFSSSFAFLPLILDSSSPSSSSTGTSSIGLWMLTMPLVKMRLISYPARTSASWEVRFLFLSSLLPSSSFSFFPESHILHSSSPRRPPEWVPPPPPQLLLILTSSSSHHLSGTAQKRNWKLDADEKEVEGIIDRCCALCPELGGKERV